MNKSTLSALVAALMLGSGITGYLIGKPGDSLDKAAPPTRTATAPAPAPPPAAAPQTPAAPSPAPTPAALPTTTPAPAAPAEAFAYRRLSIDNSAAEAESCLFFNKPLADGRPVKYDDYVRIVPEVKSALRVVDDKLCLGGLAYGTDLHRSPCWPACPAPTAASSPTSARSRWRWARVPPSCRCRARASSCRAAAPPACRSPRSMSASSRSRSIA